MLNLQSSLRQRIQCLDQFKLCLERLYFELSATLTTPDHLVLPVPPLAGQDALSDADLDHVSGGNRFYDQVQTFGPSFTTGIPGIFGLR